MKAGATPHKNARHPTEMPHENVNRTLSNRNKHLYFTTQQAAHVTSCDQNWKCEHTNTTNNIAHRTEVKVPTVQIRQLKTIASQSTNNSRGVYKKFSMLIVKKQCEIQEKWPDMTKYLSKYSLQTKRCWYIAACTNTLYIQQTIMVSSHRTS